MVRRGHISWAVFGAVMLCAVVSASAQVPPPSRNSGSGKEVPRYVDSADYDPQPYYVDGVEYKPYTPDKKKAKPAAAAASSASQPVTPTSQPAAELHPYVPADSVQARAEPVAKPAQVAAASSSSTSSVSSYVPKKRPRYGSAIIESLDKVTAKSVRFEAPLGQPVRYKGLIYLVKACETSAEDEAQSDVFAYMQVRTASTAATNTSPAVRSKEVFHGWTFASSPSLNPMQHPTYDAWVIGCRKPLAS